MAPDETWHLEELMADSVTQIWYWLFQTTVQAVAVSQVIQHGRGCKFAQNSESHALVCRIQANPPARCWIGTSFSTSYDPSNTPTNQAPPARGTCHLASHIIQPTHILSEKHVQHTTRRSRFTNELLHGLRTAIKETLDNLSSVEETLCFPPQNTGQMWVLRSRWASTLPPQWNN